MTDPSAAGQLTHGFLFADLRGYTAYAEARGDTAAADLLDKYRVLVRGVLGELGGAEIKTEGDSFYLVFPSASRAVAAGLAIAARAAEASAADPTSPIRVGVGIHAGEAEERAEGYVGTAVNIAARVCAQARPGEVLVTETVRALTRTSGRYRFTARGRPTLKGIAEPVALFAVESADAASVTVAPERSGAVRSSGPRLALVAVAVVAVVGITAAGALSMVTSGGQRPSAAASSGSAGGAASARAAGASAAGPAGSASSNSPVPFTGGPLAAGRHCSETFTPSICLVTPAGWTEHAEIPQEILLSDQDLDNVGGIAAPIPELGSWFESVTISRPTVYVVPCSPIKHLSDDSYEPITTSIETTGQGFIDQLRSNRALTVSPPLPTNLGASDATLMEVALADTCGSSGKQMVYMDFFQKRYGDSAVPFQYKGFTAVPGARNQLFVLTHDGALIVIAVTAPAAKFDEFANTAKGLLASLEFAPAP